MELNKPDKDFNWVSFHTHTTFSYADGLGTVREHVKRVADLGMSALGLSEHGNVNSHASLEQECKAAGIKPIYGCEVYFGPVGDKKTRRKTHLTIFAMNEEGYQNLNRIITQSYLDAYQWPTVSWENLVKHNKGIVVLSGCSDSFISCTLLGGKFLGDKREPSELDAERIQRSGVRRKLERFLSVFGPDRFYLEVQRFPSLERTCALNRAFGQLSADTGIPLIATADVHYPYPSDNKMQALIHAARWKSSPEFIAETAWEYQASLTYPESDKEIYDNLVATGLSKSQARMAIRSTTDLAARCTVELPKAKPLRFPGVNIENAILCRQSKVKETEKDLDTIRSFAATLHLMGEIKKGWARRKAQRPDLASRSKEYSARVSHEMKIIGDKDFSDYFLAVADLVQKAKVADTTVGPGRGSAAGSLVCYLLGITEIDPIHPTFERMIFERFIDPNRSDMPDIDLDFDDELRYKTAQDARELYGQENVANVGNHNKYRGKSALKDVARAYGLPLKVFDPIAKRCAIRVETDDRVDDSIEDIIDSYASDPGIAALVDQFPRQISEAIRLEGNQHSMGIHAGGFVISSDPISNVCAIYTKTKGSGRKKELAQVIPYEKRDAEYLGMLKMDFLGLTTMGMIGLCRKWIGMDLNTLYNMFYVAPDFEHERILELFQADDVMGIFQYEGGTTRQVVREVRPATFDELAACNALSRPGPFYGGQTRDYIAVKHGHKDWERIHETGFDRHVEWTYGQIVYQEQIMWILRDLAGFTNPEVLRVRKIIGKKLGEFQFEAIWKQFESGCLATSGIDSDTALRVFSSIRTAAGYAFNTAHAYSYALIAWWQAWFKIHCPTEFFAATLAKNGDGKNDIPRRTALLQDAIRHDIWIEKPNIQSGINWEPDKSGEKAIVAGLRQIPTIGEATADDIDAWLEQSGFRHPACVNMDELDWDTLILVKGVGKTTIEKIKSFVSQEDCFGIHKTEKQLEVFRQQLAAGDFEPFGLPSADEFIVSNGVPEDNDHVAFVGLVANVVHRDEVESIRIRTGQTVEEIKASMDRPEDTKKATIFSYDEFGEVALRVSRWRYGALASKLNAIKEDHHIVVAWGRTFEGKAGSIQVTNLWILDPD